MTIKTGSIDSPTSTGNQAYTGIGFQPKALIIFSQGQTTYTEFDNGSTSVGFSDGSNDASQYVTGVQGSDTGFSGGFSSANILGVGTNLVAAVVSFDSDGFTLNFSTVETTARKISYVAIGGSDITNVECGVASPGVGSGNVEVNLTGSFQPDVVMLFGRDGTKNCYGFGWTVGSGIGDEAAVSGRYRTGTTRARYVSWDNERCYIAADDSAIPNAEFFLSTFDTDGFTLSRSASTGAQSIAYLAIKGGNWAAGSFTSPTSTGNASVTGEAFTPEGVLFIPVDGTSVDDDIVEKAVSLSAMDDSGAEYGHSITFGNNTPDVSLSQFDDKAISYRGKTGTVEEAADYTSVNSDGFTVNYTTAAADANQVFYLMMDGGAEAGGGGRIMSSLANNGGLAGHGGLAGIGGGLAG